MHIPLVLLLLAFLCFPPHVFSQESKTSRMQNALLLMKKLQFNEAAEILRQLSVEYPNDVYSWTYLGASYLSLSNFEQAYSALSKAHDLAPNDSSVNMLWLASKARLFEVTMDKAVAEIARGNLDRAFELTKKAETIRDCLSVRFAYYEIYTRLNKTDLANQELEKAYKLDPSLRLASPQAQPTPQGDLDLPIAKEHKH